MQVIVEYSNSDILKLLQDLEQLNLLRLLPFQQTEQPTPKKRKWAGSISSETADALYLHIEKMRNEWERNI